MTLSKSEPVSIEIFTGIRFAKKNPTRIEIKNQKEEIVNLKFHMV